MESIEPFLIPASAGITKTMERGERKRERNRREKERSRRESEKEMREKERETGKRKSQSDLRDYASKRSLTIRWIP